MRVLLLVLVSLWGLSAAAKPVCFPPTVFYYPVDEDMKTGITERAFNKQIDLVEKQFADEVQALGFKLEFRRLWKDGTVNSDTYVDGDKWIINSYGGLARFDGMTADGYLAVACHELGHHMGGLPHYTGEDWASVEGESDYFATRRCMREIGIPQARIEKAAQALADVLGALNGQAKVSRQTPDKTVVKKTYEGHPNAQCRFDTYINGMECEAEGPFSDSDVSVGACMDYASKKGVRPLCWFKP